MTDIQIDLPFSRRDLLKGGGALIVGFSLGGRCPARQSAARGDVAGPPDPNTVDTWIAIHADNTATVYFGKCELGQGNTTGLLQIAGEELDLDMSQMQGRAARHQRHARTRARPARARRSIAAGRNCARRRPRRGRRCCSAPSTRLGVQTGSLAVSKGVVSSTASREPLGQVWRPPRRQAVQREIHRHRAAEADRTATSSSARACRASISRTRSRATYMHMQHVRVPDMLHGRVVLPRGQRAYGAGAKPLSVDESSIKDIPTARVVRKGDFVGVVAEQRMGRDQGRARSSR